MAGILVVSDKSVIGRKAAIVSRRKQYSDLDVTLTRNITQDITPLIDIDAVKASVKNLVLTYPGERPFQPGLGSAVKALLFEPADRITITILKQSILDVLKRNEPRINSVQVDIIDDSENNRYVVDLKFVVISINEVIDITFYLQRVR